MRDKTARKAARQGMAVAAAATAAVQAAREQVPPWHVDDVVLRTMSRGLSTTRKPISRTCASRSSGLRPPGRGGGGAWVPGGGAPPEVQ